MIVEQNASGDRAMSDAEVVAALRCSPLFAETADAEIAALAASCRIQSAPAGTIILKEGDRTDDVYLLLGGELLVYTHDDTGRQLALARLSEVNAYVGEQGFLSAHRARRSASVQAVTDSRLLRVPGSAFEMVLEQRNALRRSLREQGSRQIRDKVSQQVALLRHLASGHQTASPCWKKISRTAASSAGRARSGKSSTSSCPAVPGCFAPSRTATSCNSRGCRPGNRSASSA